MDTKFKIFSKKNFGNVRTLLKGDGTIWFLSNDVTKILGYKNNTKALTDHTSHDDRKTLKYKAFNDSLKANLWGQNDFSDKTVINESGLYCLIFGSKLPAAQDFKLWVTHEVLPSIRKNGGYIMGQENLPAESRKALEKKILKLSKEVQAQSECADTFEKYYEDILDLYKKLKDENTTLSQDLQDALTRLDENDMVVGTGATGISTELNYFYDNFGNKYTTAEEAVAAISAARE